MTLNCEKCKKSECTAGEKFGSCPNVSCNSKHDGLCHGSCTKAPSDWKKDFDERFRYTDENGKVDDRLFNVPLETVKSFITTLIQKKESAARKDERERCEKAVENVSEKHKHLKKIHPITSGGIEIACRSIVEAIRNRKDV